MCLWNLKQNQSGSISGIAPNLPANFKERLEHLGFFSGEVVTCTKWTPFNGPRLFRVGDSIFSLAEDIASAVMIEVPR